MATLEYFAGTDLNYRVQFSTDLKRWDDAGVSYSALDEDSMQTAGVAIGSGPLYLRLAIDHAD